MDPRVEGMEGAGGTQLALLLRLEQDVGKKSRDEKLDFEQVLRNGESHRGKERRF